MPVYKSMGYLGPEGIPFKRGPTTFIGYIILGYLPGIVQVDYDQIGIITFPYKAPFLYLEQLGRIMAHFFHYPFQAYFSRTVILQHGRKGMLDQWAAGRGKG